MDYSFLGVLENGYLDMEMTFLENSGDDVKESNDFYDKYIRSELAKDLKTGIEIESDFVNAVVKQKQQSFKDGFRACIQMLLECASDKAVKS